MSLSHATQSSRSLGPQSHGPLSHGPAAASGARGAGGPGMSAAKRPASGPFGNGALNGALSSAFGRSLGGLDAAFGQGGENKAMGAQASTAGRSMSFGAGVSEDSMDGASLEAIGHEAAHALAGGGSGKHGIDQKGDAGERKADTAGKRFRAWGERGFEGPAPKLEPAHGGQAEVHRKPDSAGVTLTGVPALQRGSSGSLVKELQRLLNLHGARLDLDGDFGRNTSYAVMNFQSDHGLLADGVVGPKTAASLEGSGGSSASGGSSGSTSSSSGGSLDGKPALQQGSKGSLVKKAQELLNKYGADVDADGVFGALTASAVRSFQSANGLDRDGVIGPGTAAKLTSGKANQISSGGGGSGDSGGSYAGNDAYDSMRDAVLAAAKSHMGARYYWGADGPSMFDCSGLVLYVLRQDTGLVNWGDDTAQGIRNRVSSTKNPKKGDFVFSLSGGSAQHIQIATGSGTGTIGANGGGSRTKGDDPNARVKYGDWSQDSRKIVFGSIEEIIAAKAKKK